MSTIKEIIVVSNVGEMVSYEPKKLCDYEAMEGEKAFSHSFISDTMRKLIGRTLTIIDASILDRQQNKAMKDLVRNAFSDEMEFSSKIGYDQNVLDEMIDESTAHMTDEEFANIEPVLIEEALGVK
jgi:hypothetical protein